MRRLVHTVHTSLDGRIEGPDGEFDWLTVGPELSAYALEVTERADTLLYGRVVFEMLAAHWPYVRAGAADPHDVEFAEMWRATHKVVVSRSPRHPEWAQQLICGDVQARIRALKREPGRDILLNGGARLAGALTAMGLVDEIHVAVHGVVLGGGRSALSPLPGPVHLEPVESTLLDGLTVVTRYRPVTATPG